LTAATEPFHEPRYTTPKPPLPMDCVSDSSSIHSCCWFLACVLRISCWSTCSEGCGRRVGGCVWKGGRRGNENGWRGGHAMGGRAAGP
jgi:hypothetical protein